MKIKKIIIVDKEPNSFKPGFWDIDIKYVFSYRLIFREADGDIIGRPVKANSIFNKRVTLFGSAGTDLVLATDLLGRDSETLDSDPFVLVEGNAVTVKCLQNRYTYYYSFKLSKTNPEELEWQISSLN